MCWHCIGYCLYFTMLMKPYTNAKLLSSIERSLEILDEPIKPCFCAGWERCRCRENELIDQINEVYTLLEDAIRPNNKRSLDIELAKLARAEKAMEALALED